MTVLGSRGVLPTLEQPDDTGKVVTVNQAGDNYVLEAAQVHQLPDYSDAASGSFLRVVANPPFADANFAVAVTPATTVDGGTYTLTFDGVTTAPAAFDAYPDTSLLGEGFVLQAVPASGAVSVVFQESLGAQPIDPERFAFDFSGLTGPDAPYIGILEVLNPGVTAGPKILEWYYD